MNKKNLAKKYFIIVSATFILGLIFAYGTRLIHFYSKENKNSEGEEIVNNSNYFNDLLENTINVTDSNGGLYLDKENYIYKYDANENYLWYSGQLWRILKINENKTITIITDEAIALLNAKYEDNEYLEDFLNEFYEKLDQTLLVKYKSCNDEVTEGKGVRCESTKEVNIASLDVYNYNKCGGAKSFLNNGTSYWLNNKNTEGNYLLVNNDGGIGVGSDIAHNLRPMVTLKDKIELIDGDGTKENPYIIEKRDTTTISNTLIGEYIKYNESVWRIINIDETSVKALKTTCIEDENGECLNYKFGTIIKYYNSLLYKYLNNTYYKTLENNDYLVKGNFYSGTYTDYNYKSLKENITEAYIGLPKIAEYYGYKNLNSYLITPNVMETVYTINDLGNYYLVKPTKELNIYPVINFDINLNITTGSGTIDNPYELSR